MVANLDESFSCKVCKHSTISDFSGIVYPKASWGKHDIPSRWEEEGRERRGGGKREKEREEGGDGNGEEGGKREHISKTDLNHSNNPQPLGIPLNNSKHR